MKLPCPFTLALALPLLHLSAMTGAHAQGFAEDLGTLPGAAGAIAYGVSADGAVVVGDSGSRAFRWTRATGMQDLGALPGATDAVARGISDDGSVIVGGSGGRAFRWTAATGMQDLGLLPGATSAIAIEVSAGGDFIVGRLQFGQGSSHVFRWSAGTGMQDLGAAGYPSGIATGVSRDGSVVVGTVNGNSAFVWTPATGIYELTVPNSFVSYTSATGVSDDGRIVVGVAYLWPVGPGGGPSGSDVAYALDLQSGNWLNLHQDPWLTSWFRSESHAVDGTGSVVVGLYNNDLARWSAATGTEFLDTLPGLGNQWHIATDVSPDGAVVVGWADNGGGPATRRAVRWGPPEIGASFCTPNPNSTGVTGRLTAGGSASVAAADVRLVATQLPHNALGYALGSLTQGHTPNPAGSAGVICLGGAIGRYVGPGQIQSSGATGSFELRLELARTPTPTGFVAISAGETWSFQVWHRDVAGGSVTSNFTNGVEIAFL